MKVLLLCSAHLQKSPPSCTLGQDLLWFLQAPGLTLEGYHIAVPSTVTPLLPSPYTVFRTLHPASPPV